MKITWSFLVLVCVATFVSLSIAVDYCELKCPDGSKHTMCKYEDAPAKACTKYYNNKLTQKEKDELVDAHNKLRQKVALGKEKRGKPGPQPPATNMLVMRWDDELATIAQRWANQCDFGHDKCRNVERYRVGQNVGTKSITAKNTFPMSSYVQAWYDEVELFNSSQVPNVTNFKDVGHYTQVVWATSNRVGCGVMRYIRDSAWNTTYIVCNYGPAGNWYGTAMYKIPRKSDKERTKDKSEGDGEGEVEGDGEVEGGGSVDGEGDGKVESREEEKVGSEEQGKVESREEEKVGSEERGKVESDGQVKIESLGDEILESNEEGKTEGTKEGEVKHEEGVDSMMEGQEKLEDGEKGNQEASE